MTERPIDTDFNHGLESGDKRSDLPVTSHCHSVRVMRRAPRKKVPKPPKTMNKKPHLLPSQQVHDRNGGCERMDIDHEDFQQHQQGSVECLVSNNAVQLTRDNDSKIQSGAAPIIATTASNCLSAMNKPLETRFASTPFTENTMTSNENSSLPLSTDPKTIDRRLEDNNDSCYESVVLKGIHSYDKANRALLIDGVWGCNPVSNNTDSVDPHQSFHLECSLSAKEDTTPLKLDGMTHVYHGSFTFRNVTRTPNGHMKKVNGRTVDESGVEITFSKTDNGNFDVFGRGNNEIGDFQLTGTAIATDKENEYRITMTKQYFCLRSILKPSNKNDKVEILSLSSDKVKRRVLDPSRSKLKENHSAENPKLHQQGLSNPTAVFPPGQDSQLDIATDVYGCQKPQIFKRFLLKLDKALTCEQRTDCQHGPACVHLKNLWKRHISNCHSKNCSVFHCTKYRQMLSHFDNCTSYSCQFCAPIIRKGRTWLMARRNVNSEQAQVSGKTNLAISDSATPPTLFQKEIVFHTNFIGLKITPRSNRFVVTKVIGSEYAGRVFLGDELTHIGAVEVRNESKTFFQTVISKSSRPISIKFTSSDNISNEPNRGIEEEPNSQVRPLEKRNATPANSLVQSNTSTQTTSTTITERPPFGSVTGGNVGRNNTHRHDFCTGDEEHDRIEHDQDSCECRFNAESKNGQNQNMQDQFSDHTATPKL